MSQPKAIRPIVTSFFDEPANTPGSSHFGVNLLCMKPSSHRAVSLLACEEPDKGYCVWPVG
jgi:hypothetical protein